MEESLLYDALYDAYLSDFRAEFKNKNESDLAQCVQNSREVLEKNFNDEQLKLVDDYIFNFSVYEDFINHQTGVKILNYGVKIGMQLQKASIEIDQTE